MDSLHHQAADMSGIGQTHRSWPTARPRFLPIVYSLILIGLGVAACVFPFAGALFAGYYLGWTLMAAGVSCVIAGVSHWRERGHWLDLMLGLVTLVFGCSFLVLPIAGAALVLWSLSLWFAISGAMEIMAAIHFREGRVTMIFVGIVDFILSGCLLLAFASLDLALVSLLVGFSLTMRGVAAFVRGAGFPSPETKLV